MIILDAGGLESFMAAGALTMVGFALFAVGVTIIAGLLRKRRKK